MLGNNYRRWIPPAPVNVNLPNGFYLYLTDASTALPVPPSRLQSRYNQGYEYFYLFNIPSERELEFRNDCERLGFRVMHPNSPLRLRPGRGQIVFSLGRGRFYAGASRGTRHLQSLYREYSPNRFYRMGMLHFGRAIDM